jgi:hypothetical protein
MRDTVIVDGVTLTRAQVEKAMEQLNDSDAWFQPGDVVALKNYPNEPRLVLADGKFADHKGVIFEPLITKDYRLVASFAGVLKFYREAKGL